MEDLVMKKFWQAKRVMVTGYEGFIGSHLTKRLLEYKSKVIGLDILTHRKKTFLSGGDLKKIKIIKGSVANYKLVDDLLRRYSVDLVFHLAAESIVGRALKNPLRAFSTNIKGTWNVLEASRVNGVRAVVVASSDKAYGSHRVLPYKESYSLLGRFPYDASKACADSLASSYFHSYELPVSITRCGNVFGPADYNLSRIVPDAINSCLGNKTLIIRSNGLFCRDYIYIKDIVSGYILLAYRLFKGRSAGEVFNFSNQKPLSVLELVNSIYRQIGKKPKYKVLNSAKCEIINQYLSAAKAKRVLGWRPKYSLERGLKETISWHSRSKR